MTTVDVETVTVDIAIISTLFTFVNIRAGETVSAVAVCACTCESADTVRTARHCVASSLAIGTLVDIGTLAIAEHETSQTAAMEGAGVVDA